MSPDEFIQRLFAIEPKQVQKGKGSEWILPTMVMRDKDGKLRRISPKFARGDFEYLRKDGTLCAGDVLIVEHE